MTVAPLWFILAGRIQAFICFFLSGRGDHSWFACRDEERISGGGGGREGGRDSKEIGKGSESSSHPSRLLYPCYHHVFSVSLSGTRAG